MTLRLSCLTLAALLLFGGVALAKPQVAVLGLEVIDKSGSPTPADAQVAEELTQRLRERAKTSGPYSLAPNAEKELIDQKLIKSCDDEKPSCMQSIGKDLAADFLLYGHIEKQNNAYQVTMFLFDVARKTREKTYPETIPLSESAGPPLAGWARKIYSKLTGQTDSCIIVVKTNGVDAGTILINGAPKGSITNGVGQVNGLSEGRYKIAVEAKDYHRWEKSDITCSAGQTTTVPADMERIETGGATTATTTTTGPDLGITGSTSQPSSSSHKGLWRDVAIVGVVGGLASGGLWVYGWSKTSNYGNTKNWVFADSNGNEITTTNMKGTFAYVLHDDQCNSIPSSVDGKPVTFATNSPAGTPPPGADGQPLQWGNSAFHDACKNHIYTVVGPILTGVFAAAIGVSLYMYIRDSGDSDERPVNVTGARHKARRPPFAIVPVVSPDGAGMTFSMTW